MKHFQIKYGVVINKWDINKSLSRIIKKSFARTFLGMLSYNKEVLKVVSYLIPIMETDLKIKKEIGQIFDKLDYFIKKQYGKT